MGERKGSAEQLATCSKKRGARVRGEAKEAGERERRVRLDHR